MGLFDRFSKEGREQSAVEKNSKRVMSKHAQSADRFVSLEKLKEIGTDEALFGLVRRFSYNYDKTIEDEQEKEWVASALGAMGPRALPALRRFIKQAETLAYPLRVLGNIATPEQILEIMDEILAREEPGYTRDPGKKLQVLGWLSEWKGVPTEEVVRRINPYLADFDEGVRFAAIEALSHHPAQESSRVPLLDALCRPEEESRRIKLRAAEVLAQGGWPVTSHKDRVSELLSETLPEFGMQNDRLVSHKDKKRDR